jgi:hypothetical protein
MTNADGPIFQLGDTVRLGDVSNVSAKVRDRTGVIVGRSRTEGKLRVLWNRLKRPQIVDSTRLELANSERPAIPSREALLITISEELERIRDARFERHLKWPREISLQTYQPLSPRAPRAIEYLPAGIIGLTATSIAIGAAYVLIGW